MKYVLDIIIPCYNPPEGWERVVAEQMLAVQEQLTETEIAYIIVDDGSTQNMTSSQIDFLIEQPQHVTVLRLPTNLGKGAAVKHGVAHSKASIIAFTDNDFPYEVEYMSRMYNQIVTDSADIVIGHRKNEYYQSIPVMRRWLSKLFRMSFKFLLNIPVSDTQSGLKFFNEKGKAALLDTKIERYLFDLEFIKIAARKNLRINSIELTLRKGIVLPPFAMRILMKELGNFIKILFS